MGGNSYCPEQAFDLSFMIIKSFDAQFMSYKIKLNSFWISVRASMTELKQSKHVNEGPTKAEIEAGVCFVCHGAGHWAREVSDA